MPNQYVNKVVKSDGTTLIDLTQDTVTQASHIMAGHIGHLADGSRVPGTGQSGPSATAHTIHFEFDGNYSPVNITFYADSIFILDAIRATTPSTYDSKTVTLAQLDGVTWYEPADIPLNTQLIEYNDVLTGHAVNDDGTIITSDYWNCVTDYTEIDPTMTFTFICAQYAYIGFYDSNKTPIEVVVANDVKDSTQDYYAYGTLNSGVIPLNARYVVLQGNSYSINSSRLSLIRTA